MIRLYRQVLIFGLIVFWSLHTTAQMATMPVKVAVFAPLYLEEAFSGTEYRLGKSSLPKHIMPGLEFYNGVMMAVDSLNHEGEKVQINIYDSRQDALSLERLMKSSEFMNVGLIIASLNSTTELKLYSNIAQSRKIPLVSATYPNYVGIKQNPFFVLLNSSFTTHLQGVYKYMQRNHALDQVIAIKRKGATEDYIRKSITDLNKGTFGAPLRIRWVEVPDQVTIEHITPHLDSLKNNVVFVASPLESFGIRVAHEISKAKEYTGTIVGMPTWDAVKEFNNRDFDNIDIVYSTPFHYSGNQDLYTSINRSYKSKFHSRPSDMVFRGFETTYHFTKLLSRHKNNLLNNLSDKQFTVFNEFDIQAVKLKQTDPQPDFLENKKLYFVKKREGRVLSVN